jgi:sorting nexin-9/18/33
MTKRQREASSSTIKGNAETPTSQEAAVIVPQHTGDWFPSFRQSLLGGKSLNRFSSFVTSGAEEFVLKGSSAENETSGLPNGRVFGHGKEESSASTNTTSSDDENANKRRSAIYVGKGEADRHFVDASHAWKEKIPPFRVLVHSPSKQTSTISGAFTIYSVTSYFRPPEDEVSDNEDDSAATPEPTTITVQRRYSHFVTLHTALTRRLPGIALPPLPEKQYAGRFSDDFVEARRGDLERYVNRVVRHPVARYAEITTFFLSCESDAEWKALLPKHLSLPPAGPAFYAHVYHPAFNLDLEDTEDAIARFTTHTRGVGKGVQGLRSVFAQVRQARAEMSKAERLLSYSLLSLITGKTMAEAPTTGTVEEDEEYNAKDRGISNEDGAWCWREGCEGMISVEIPGLDG